MHLTTHLWGNEAQVFLEEFIESVANAVDIKYKVDSFTL